jgi:hypothetical protein
MSELLRESSKIAAQGILVAGTGENIWRHKGFICWPYVVILEIDLVD